MLLGSNHLKHAMVSKEEVKIIHEKINEEDTINGVQVLQEKHYDQEVEILYERIQNLEELPHDEVQFVPVADQDDHI